MSLFAAYAEQAKDLEEISKNVVKPSWLENSSFKINVIENVSEQLELISDDNSTLPDRPTSRKSKRHSKKKRKCKKCKTDLKTDNDNKILNESDETEINGFLIDTKSVREYYQVSTISRPAVAKYRTKYYLTSKNDVKKRKFKRYFKKLLEIKPDQRDKDESRLQSTADQSQMRSDEQSAMSFSTNEETNISKQTAFYNRSITENPNDIKLWLDYIKFQDSAYQYERSNSKGSIAKAQRVLAERKITILDKAIEQNPSADVLLRERLKVTVNAYPSDELQLELKKLVEKEQSNIILWQAYIEATQCSMSHCNATNVLSLYTKCLATLHKIRRMEQQILEENILHMLYLCGLFLKQAGLFEQLWCMLRIYLEVTLSPANKDTFNCAKYFNEKELLDLEEVVFSSQLPHHELWLRVEKLRESCHWLPFGYDAVTEENEECVDPQRIIFTDDIVELIHPITMPENVFQLIATVFTLLKIPLIPSRHFTVHSLGIDYVSWSLDSVEALLSMFIPMHPIDNFNNNLLKDVNRLTVGPQYLKTLPGQDEYLDFILTLMENCANCLKETDQIAVRIWWFRFQRLLIVLDKQHHFKMNANLKKRIKNGIKNFLKLDNRNNEIYYTEYALIEKEFGNAEKCIQILEMTAKNKPLVFDFMKSTQQSKEATSHCFLIRNMVDVLLSQSDQDGSAIWKNKILIHLIKLALQRDVNSVTNGVLMEAETKFRLITNHIIDNEVAVLTPAEHFTPVFLVEWIICNCWFIYLYKGIFDAINLLKTIMKQMESIEGFTKSLQLEIINELYCSLLSKYCFDNPRSGISKTLKDALLKSIENYPNNLYILTLLAYFQSKVKSLGTAWWNVENVLISSDEAIPTLFAVIICDLVMSEMEQEMKDSITGDAIESSNYKNRMLSLFKKITDKDMCTRRCGLIWRLYLQFAYNYFTPEICKNIYYIALEECPWLKALYMDAAIYVPGDLAQIQDLIIEKQLRLHVTPEELEILRE